MNDRVYTAEDPSPASSAHRAGLSQQAVADWIADYVGSFSRLLAGARNFVDIVAPCAEAFRRLHLDMSTPAAPADETLQQRALRLRRGRNTGPLHPQRAPRRIDPHRGR